MKTSLSLIAAVASLLFSTTLAEPISASGTDVGSILKSMDQTKLKVPAEARAVMVKMPEKKETVTEDDRKAIKDCIANKDLDQFTVQACKAEDDQLTVLLDKKRISNSNMVAFVKAAMAKGAKMEA